MSRQRTLLVASILGVGAVVLALGLVVYPFQFGLVESTILICAFLLAGVWEFVLEDTSF